MLRFGVNSPVDRLPSCGIGIQPSAAGVTAISVGDAVPFTTTELTSRIAPTSFSDVPIFVGRIWFGSTGFQGPGVIAFGFGPDLEPVLQRQAAERRADRAAEPQPEEEGTVVGQGPARAGRAGVDVHHVVEGADVTEVRNGLGLRWRLAARTGRRRSKGRRSGGPGCARCWAAR